MIVAGEASGDMHGALLVRELKKLAGNIQICGIGGNEIAAQGVEILLDASRLAVVGLLEVLSHLKDIRRAMRSLEKRMIEQRPDLLILIDYPDFNLMLAKKAKRLGIKTFYYVSPQVWAWRSGRVKVIKKLIDRMAVILPFEKKFYADRGMCVDFVGHPLLDGVTADQDQNAFRQKYSLSPESIVIGIMPGSRRKEIAALLPFFLKAAELLQKKIPNAVFLLPLASTLTPDILMQHGLDGCEANVKIITEERYSLMACCSAVMAASGTITLELAILGTPMLVAYRVSPLSYFIGRHLVHLPYFSLVNLVAESRVVPELLQQEVTPENIAGYIEKMVKNQNYRRNMLDGLSRVKQLLGDKGASKKAAAIALELLASPR
jgi:lipid-A-disaccharide synthase